MAVTIRPLPIAVLQPASLGTLIATVGCTKLVAPSLRPTRIAAVALTVVTSSAEEKQSTTAKANARTERILGW